MNGLDVVSDGFNGEYTYVGKIICSDEFENIDVNAEASVSNVKSVQNLIFNHMDIEDAPIKLWLFTHYR